jgi:Protein of unknown function (DUF4236)
MGWRYRKSVRLGPVRLNMSRRGIGQSIGVRGARITRSARGERYVTFTVPGTGWSYRKKLGGAVGSRRRLPPGGPPPLPPPTPTLPPPMPQPTSGPPPPLTPHAGSPPTPPTGSSGGGPLPDWLDDQLRRGQP